MPGSPTADTFDFEAVYTTFFPRIVRYLTRLIGPDGAEDLAQEVFLKISRSLGEKLWKQSGDTPAFDRGRKGFRDQSGVSLIFSTASEFRGESSLSTWVYRIATNAATDKIRGAEHKSFVSAGSPCGDGDAPVPDLGASAEQQVIRGEMSECVRSLVDELPESYRTVLVFSEVESLRDAEIADVLGVTLETVKIRLHRLPRRLYGDAATLRGLGGVAVEMGRVLGASHPEVRQSHLRRCAGRRRGIQGPLVASPQRACRMASRHLTMRSS